MDCKVERVCIGEGPVGEVVGLEIAPDGFDVVQLRRVFGQPRNVITAPLPWAYMKINT
jgi:hypothetical protein